MAGSDHFVDPFEDGERLELLWYDAVAQRRAVITRLQLSLGVNLELRSEGDVPPDLLELHEALLRCTGSCIELRRRWDSALSRQYVAVKKSTPGPVNVS